MRTIKERDILSIAPNASAVSNAKKISSGSQFVKRSRMTVFIWESAKEAENPTI